MRTQKQKNISYVVIILSIIVVAALGTLFVNLGMAWFSTLNTPSQFVPNALIPVMWTLIYIVFAVVLLLWTSKQAIPTKTSVLLIINGVLQILWCFLFFTLNSTLLGLIFIVLILIFSILLVLNIFSYNKIYGYLTAIYPLWVSVATCLNLALWILN